MAEPSIYELLMGSGPGAAESAAAMADQIRRGRKAAMAGALGSPGAIGAMGQLAAKNSQADQLELERGATQRARYGEEAKTREADFKRAADDRNAQLRQTLAIIAANKPQFHATPGTEVAGYELDPKTGHYVPIGDRDPNAGGRGGGKGNRVYSPGESDKLQDANKLLGYVTKMHDTFKDEYAGESELGDYELKFDQWRGSKAKPKDQERANYWKEIALNLTNPQRHDLFGSALTSTEEAAWKAANPITIKSSPAEVRRALASLRDILNKRLSERATGRVSEGFGEEATAQYLSNTDFAKSRGKAAEVKKISTKEERDALSPGTKYVGPDGQTYTKR